jgi:glutamyl-tRNA reductase
MNRTLTGDEAVMHLCKVAAGAESQIWGDDQIITQVDDAIKAAQKAEASDAILNTMFRISVSAGKKAKTLVDFKVDDNSTAARAAGLLKHHPSVKQVLVIGNGIIGRATAEMLVQAGLETTMTLRQYRHGENIVPAGCRTVNYGERYRVLSQCDAVVSATTSPHFTISYEEVKKLDHLPEVFVDLAVPRDIDPKVADLDQVSYYDIDQVSQGSRDARQEEQMREIETIIGKYIEDFHQWHSYRERNKA